MPKFTHLLILLQVPCKHCKHPKYLSVTLFEHVFTVEDEASRKKTCIY